MSVVVRLHANRTHRWRCSVEGAATQVLQLRPLRLGQTMIVLRSYSLLHSYPTIREYHPIVDFSPSRIDFSDGADAKTCPSIALQTLRIAFSNCFEDHG